jgi:hypothetical protein
MYEGKIGGKTVRFSDEAFCALKSRFNPKRLDKKLAFPGKRLEIKCQLCSAYKTKHSGCGNCPLAVFELDFNNDAGCVHLLKKELGKYVTRTVDMQEDYIDIRGSSGRAREYFQKIQDILLAKFKKVPK